MFAKLKEVELRYQELSDKLSDPKIIARQDEFHKISKEFSDLREVVECYRTYQKLEEELVGSQELLSSGDPEMEELAQAEIEAIEPKKTELEAHLKFLLLPKDPNDDKNVFVEIRAGTGGDEAALFAAEMLRLYLRFAERKRWQVEIVSKHETGLGGLKEAIILLQGAAAYSHLKFEGGVHRVQRVPVTETSGRIHTSAVTVAILPEAQEVDVKIDAKELKIDVMRAGGPGGQSVNTTDSAVRITHIPSGLVVICQDEKSQHKNKAKAMRVLRARLLEQEQAKQNESISSARRLMVGSGDRSERIRTYNFPQNRMTDHRVGLTLHRLEAIMDGDIDEIVSQLQTHHQMELLKGEES